MATKKTSEERDPLDRYYTPEWVVNLWWEHVYPLLPKKPQTVLEPSVGGGAFLKRWNKATQIVTVDADPDVPQHEGVAKHFNMRFEEFAALLGSPAAKDRFDLALGNTPFECMQDHVDLMWRLAASVSVLGRIGFMSSDERADWWKGNPPAFVHILPNRPAFSGPLIKRKTTDRYDYAFYTWAAGVAHEGTQLFWLPKLDKSKRKK